MVTGAQECERLDPRIRRTRQMLADALERLLESKTIDQISVMDIAEAAELNRATFYDHYADKFDLLESLVESRFQQLMSERGIVFDGSCTMAIMGIILAMCDYLAGMRGHECPARRQMEKHFESALVAVVRNMMLQGLKQHPAAQASQAAPELIAAAASGAIYGAAREWASSPDRCPATEVVESIYGLVRPMLM